MPASAQDIWSLVSRGGPIDAQTMLLALVRAGASLDSDARSRMLRRDTLAALADHWGQGVLRRRLRLFAGEQLLNAWNDAPQEGGFNTIRERLVDATNPDVLFQMLRELGSKISEPTSIIVRGSMSLMLESLIIRKTDDADLADEVPQPLRNEHTLLSELAIRYGLKLTHFQSHYLPDNWRSRIHSLGRFGTIDAFVMDSLDVLAGKLFSNRTKDLDDVRAAWPLVDQTQFRQRLAESTDALRRDAASLTAARRNWYILTGEGDLPQSSA